MNYMVDNGLLFVNQHGFRRSLSCDTQLFEFVTDIHKNLHLRAETHAIFIDFSKAFDKVPHQRLLLKLRSLQNNETLINWIANFLSNRTQYVTLNNSCSSSIVVKSGVPQGTVLGPLLFLIYVNDLPSLIKSSIRLYADDCVVYSKVTNHSDCAQLQADLRAIESWCERWQMQINANKTKHYGQR